jgi:acetylornithine deacetylase/succinyl-diaminopimelate desuccinylase-like protein
LLIALSTASLAEAPPSTINQPAKLDAKWQAKTRTIYETSVETATVAGRGQVPKLAEYLAGELKAAGFKAEDIQIKPYEGEPGDKTVALIARWRADKPAGKPILLMAHMDVVEAKREDWKFDPFEFREESGYFYGRGSSDNKSGMVGLVTSLIKLKEAGFKPKRDLILFFTGDEETGGRARDWARPIGAS